MTLTNSRTETGTAAGPALALRSLPACSTGCDPEPDFDRLLDPARLQELLEEIGFDDLGVIVDIFLDETDEIITRIASSAPGPELAADLHFLKGCALNLGLAALAGLCHDAERCNSCGRRTPLDPGVFTAVYAASKLAIRAALEGGNGA